MHSFDDIVKIQKHYDNDLCSQAALRIKSNRLMQIEQLNTLQKASPCPVPFNVACILDTQRHMENTQIPNSGLLWELT